MASWLSRYEIFVINALKVSQNSTCLMFLGQPKQPRNLDKLDISDL